MRWLLLVAVAGLVGCGQSKPAPVVEEKEVHPLAQEVDRAGQAALLQAELLSQLRAVPGAETSDAYQRELQRLEVLNKAYDNAKANWEAAGRPAYTTDRLAHPLKVAVDDAEYRAERARNEHQALIAGDPNAEVGITKQAVAKMKQCEQALQDAREAWRKAGEPRYRE